MTFTKHFVLLFAFFALMPLAARLLANRAGRVAGQAPVFIDVPFLVQTVLVGAGLALAAQGGFSLAVSLGMSEVAARFTALGLVGLLYGAFFALQDYVYSGWALALGLLGGLATAGLHPFLPINTVTATLLVVLLTVLPVLAVEVPGGPIRRVLEAGQGLLPVRGYLR